VPQGSSRDGSDCGDRRPGEALLQKVFGFQAFTLGPGYCAAAQGKNKKKTLKRNKKRR